MPRIAHGQAIEYFLWKHSQAPDDKLIFYDERGEYYEKEVGSELIDKALKIFDGRRKATRRSNGGLISVEPYQLVVVSEGNAQKSELRIRVRFKDFKYSERNHSINGEYLSYSKTVRPEELSSQFDYAFNGAQSFAIDFGQGLVPIYVFHYEADSSGNTYAYFIELSDIDHALALPLGEKVEVQPYRVLRDVLRFVPDVTLGSSGSEYDLLRQNYLKMKEEKKLAVPDCLKAGSPILAPTGGTMQDVRHYLRIFLKRQRGAAGLGEPVYISIQREDSGELMHSPSIIGTKEE